MRQCSPRPGQLLFLCTGNYYRSRFAEELFNWRAPQAGLSWIATSRGIATELGVLNVGPISPHALRGLLTRSVPPATAHCFPRQLQEPDLMWADLAVALKEAEHRPLLEQRFPSWADSVVYWHVDDLDLARPEDALADLERRISVLVEQLSNHR
jgi:protein-tyrosine phosphatase